MEDFSATEQAEASSTAIDVVRGIVQKGGGAASRNLEKVQGLIAESSGLRSLQAGTLNIGLSEHYPLVAVTGVITAKEYDHQQECIKLRRCRITVPGNGDGGFRGVIIRPSQHEVPGRPHWLRFEVMSPHKLRTVLGLNDGDDVLVALERPDMVDEAWWSRSEPESSNS